MAKGRLRNLDIIKICAAFAICFHHYQQCFEVQFNSSILNNVLPLLGFFVELFFMISGFFAARTYKSKQDFKCQYLKKIFEIISLCVNNSYCDRNYYGFTLRHFRRIYFW